MAFNPKEYGSPEELLVACVVEGQPKEAAAALAAGVQWDLVAPSDRPLSSFLQHYFVAESDGVEEAALLVIEEAVRAGRSDVFDVYETMGPNGDTSRLEPISNLVEEGCERVIARMLEGGLDPLMPRGSHGHSVLDIATARSDSIAGLIRAFVARRHAIDLMRGAPAARM